MSISDIITIVGLIIAIIAVINEKSRQHLWLKMQVFDYFIFLIAFILVNYFVFYEDFYQHGIYIESFYFEKGGIEPKYWSYIITMICLGYFWYKIEISFYPNKLSDSVYRFYQNQIENNEIQFLLDLIEKYHKKDIILYIDKPLDTNDRVIEEYESPSVWLRIVNWKNRTVMKIFPSSRQNKEHYAVYVLHGILNDPAFIPLAANLRPYFFAEIISHFKRSKRSHFPSELVNLFLTELINNKNYWLRKELKESQNFDEGQPERYFQNNRIVGSLIKDLSVSAVNEVWRSFGEIACNEIAEERPKGLNSKLMQEFQNETIFWDFKTQFSIIFFKILIEEALKKKYLGEHFFLYYYSYILTQIFKTFDECPPPDFENKKTNLHVMIENMLSNIFHWIDLSNKFEDTEFYHSSLSCLGNFIHEITLSRYYGEQRKIDLLDTILRTYCGFNDNNQTPGLRSKFEEILLKPNMLTVNTDPYYNYLERAWLIFDKVPHIGAGYEMNYFIRLKDIVIVPLGFNPTP